MARSNGLDESESDAQGDHSRAVRLLRGTRYKCATGWRLMERILFLLCDKSRWLLYHRRFLWQVVMAALRSGGAKFIPSLEGRGFLWQFCNNPPAVLAHENDNVTVARIHCDGYFHRQESHQPSPRKSNRRPAPDNLLYN